MYQETLFETAVESDHEDICEECGGDCNEDGCSSDCPHYQEDPPEDAPRYIYTTAIMYRWMAEGTFSIGVEGFNATGTLYVDQYTGDGYEKREQFGPYASLDGAKAFVARQVKKLGWTKRIYDRKGRVWTKSDNYAIYYNEREQPPTDAQLGALLGLHLTGEWPESTRRKTKSRLDNACLQQFELRRNAEGDVTAVGWFLTDKGRKRLETFKPYLAYKAICSLGWELATTKIYGGFVEFFHTGNKGLVSSVEMDISTGKTRVRVRVDGSSWKTEKTYFNPITELDVLKTPMGA